MKDHEVKSAALDSMKGLIYQAIVALEQCFKLNEGQTIWIEFDGDVSVVGETSNGSTQTEVKNYKEPLTDHHENFWKTLKNWLAAEFDHNNYQALILHTTQRFGTTSTLNGWNQKSAKQRLKIITEIYDSRTSKGVDHAKSKVAKLQCEVLENDQLIEVLKKVHIYTEADDQEKSFENIKKDRLKGIPAANHEAFLDGLVGFVFNKAHGHSGWSITARGFDSKLQELTATYCLKEFTFPSFTGQDADASTINAHFNKSFVKKIQDIRYEDVIPEAIGNYLELHRTLQEELHNFPQYRTRTNDYQNALVSQFNRRFSRKKRGMTDYIKDSQDLYDEVIGEAPPPMSNNNASPPRPYKNGLIHDAMDEDGNLKWSVR